MSENNQIQEISSLIEETKVLLFNEILKSILKSKNAPFSEEVAHYLKEVISDDVTNPSKIGIVKMRKEGNNYIISLSGPFKSYVEINGIESNIEGGLFKLKVSDPNNVFGGKEFFVKAYQESKISKMTKQQDGTYLSEEIFNSNRSRNVEAFYFAPTNLHFSLDLFMSAYGKPQ